jgi:hypothetical protein
MFILFTAGNYDIFLNSHFISYFLFYFHRLYNNKKFNTVYSNIIVQGITIIAPVTSPNTDGINPGQY